MTQSYQDPVQMKIKSTLNQSRIYYIPFILGPFPLPVPISVLVLVPIPFPIPDSGSSVSTRPQETIARF